MFKKQENNLIIIKNNLQKIQEENDKNNVLNEDNCS